MFRSEQDKEPELEATSEVAGPGPSEESAADGMLLTGLDWKIFIITEKNSVWKPSLAMYANMS